MAVETTGTPLYRQIQTDMRSRIASGELATGTQVETELELMARYGMNLIVDMIEKERSVVDVLDFNVDFGQGYLFGSPRPVRDEVLVDVA